MNKILREHAKEIFYAGLQAVDPVEAIKRHVKLETHILRVSSQQYDLTTYQNIYVVGGGKAGAPMAKAIEDILGERLTTGIVNVKYDHLAPTQTVRVHEAGHPVPDRAAQTACALAHTAVAAHVSHLSGGRGSGDGDL